MLIVLEGLDGAGKSTQLKNISNYLISKDQKVKILHFPIYEMPVSGEMISGFLRGDFGSIESVHPMLIAMLFAENRRDALPMLKQWTQEGYHILLDRYVYSNIAFQCAKLRDENKSEELHKWILNMEFEVFGLPKPDVNFFLDVPTSFVQKKLIENRSGDDRSYLDGKSDIHEEDIEFQKRVKIKYLDLCNRDASFIRIECSDGAENILLAEKIFEELKGKLDLLL